MSADRIAARRVALALRAHHDLARAEHFPRRAMVRSAKP
jgi:hypothetical protein